MNFITVQSSINDILSVKRRYVIPRNQREFSWEKMQLDEFWDDVTKNIKFDKKEGSFAFNEYFLGTIVLAGNESSEMLEVIDGQQRLSVITIALSLISRVLRSLDYIDYANDIFNNYIVTSISTGSLRKGSTKKEKLEKTNGNDFFKLKFQDEKDHVPESKYEEDEKLLYAEQYIQRKIGRSGACQLLNKTKIGVKYTEEEYVMCLQALVEMLTRYITVVKISVGDEEDAYDIFEILNARGISLTSIDLIKNKILQYCTKTYPLDFAKNKWAYIDETLKSREGKLTLVDYVRTYWLSNYSYVGQDGLYRAFKKLIAADPANEAQVFLDNLSDTVKDYAMACMPQIEDWKMQDQKSIYECLKALSIMDVSVPTPLIMSAMSLRRNKKRFFKQSDFLDLLNKIVSFHFRYNAICKLKPSGWDQSYSSWAIELAKCSNIKDFQSLRKTIFDKIEQNTPRKNEFLAKFEGNLRYTNKKTSQKNLIRFIFERIESSGFRTDELKTNLFTLEHILPQKDNGEHAGLVGNLLPLAEKINNEIDDRNPIEKIDFYKKSELSLVRAFIKDVESKEYDLSKWGESQIKKRTKAIALMAYDAI